MAKRKTAGELSLKAASDKTIYDPLELGHAISDDVITQVQICGEEHKSKIDETEYFVILLICSDPLIQGVRRHKYYAYPFMPMPRPNQSVFLYNKITGNIKRLWSLPVALIMAKITEMTYVDKRWKETKYWCDAFFHGWKYHEDKQKWINETPHHFYEKIRKQHKIDHLCETEYLNLHREELIKAGCKVPESRFTEPFDFSKIPLNKIIDAETPIID